ncbi:MAG: Type 1 glutamine amidotransferase-like domain-containing protein [DPANN group archaeon]|nr:Type 1 glutamine amidotransferase-like domain-containing protein [DPANN group archaeon]
MRLFLSGGGSEEDSVELDKKFASVLDKSKPLLYIPVAVDEDVYPYPECLSWLSSIFNPLGVENIEMWTEKELVNNKEMDLEQFSGIYIGGGNTFYLLKALKASGFFEKLETVIKNNIPVYGGSAGAIICGKSITSALAIDLNYVELTDFKALNLIEGYDVWPHYVFGMDKHIQKSRKKYGLKLIVLPENAGLYVIDNMIEVVGPGSVYLADENMKQIMPGENV